MSALKTDYTDDVFTGNRKYTMTDNGDDTVSFTDVTTYITEGDIFTAGILNGINENIMSERDSVTLLANSWGPDGSYEISDERIEVDGIRETNQEIVLAKNPSAAQWEAFNSLGLVEVSQINGKMTVKAMDTVPTINIPVVIIFRGWK